VWFSPDQIHLLESQCVQYNQKWVTRLTDDHDGEVSAAFGNDFMFLYQVFEMKIDATEKHTHLVGQVGDADTFRHCFLDDARWRRLRKDAGRGQRPLFVSICLPCSGAITNTCVWA